MTAPASSPALAPLLGNALNQFENGCQLDLRVKLAIQFLQHNPSFTSADHALNVATDIIGLAQARGLLHELPETDELNAPMRRFIRQNVRAQVYQQVVGQKIGAEEAPHVQPAGPVNVSKLDLNGRK